MERLVREATELPIACTTIMAVRLTKNEGDGREEGEEFQIDIAMSGENIDRARDRACNSRRCPRI